MTSDATDRDNGAQALDDGTARLDRGADDRPLAYDLSTAEVVQEALAALRQDRIEPLDDALVPGMHFPSSWPVLDHHQSRPNRARIRTRRSSAWLSRPGPRPAQAAHVGGGQPDAPGPGAVAEDNARRRQWLGVPPAWLAAGVGVVTAVGVALLAVTVINQQGLEGRQPGGQIPVTAELDASRQLAPGGSLSAAVSSDPATAGAGSASAGTDSATGSQGPAPESPAPTAGTPVAPTVATPTLGAPPVGGQQPAVVSSLAAGDQGFGWPSSAFGTAGG